MILVFISILLLSLDSLLSKRIVMEEQQEPGKERAGLLNTPLPWRLWALPWPG